MPRKKIQPPEKMTNATEGRRNAVDTALSAIPGVGGPAATLGRHVFPSERDRKTAKWHSDVSEELNDQGDRLDAQAQRQLEIEDRTDRQLGEVSTRLGIVEQKTQQNIVRSDFSDIALKPGRLLIDDRKYVTALSVLDEMERDGPLINDEPQWHAKIVSLKGVCQQNLGEEKQAGALFLKALDLDPSSPKIRCNAVTGYLLQGDLAKAVTLAEELLKEDSAAPHHWLNYIQANGAVGAELSYLDQVPPAVRHDEQVMLTTLSVLRVRDDDGWRKMARDTLAEHPKSRSARRFASEATLDEVVECLTAPSSGIAAVAAARDDAKAAAADLTDLWTTLLETEVPARRTHLDLLQNAITGHRIAGDSGSAMELIESAIDELINDEFSRTIVAAVALDVDRDDILEQVFQHKFRDRAILQLEWSIRQKDWAGAISVVETHAEDLERPNEIPVNSLIEVLRAISDPETDRAKLLIDIIEKSDDVMILLTIARLARRADIDAPIGIALRRAIDADQPRSRFLRLQLAEEAARLDWQDDIIDLLQAHVDPKIEGPERYRLAVAHARVSNPRHSGEEFFRQLRPYAEKDAELQKAGGHFMMALGKPRDAVPWFRRALALEPGRAHTVLSLWQALGRSNQKRIAEKLLEDVGNESMSGEASDQLDLMQLLWRQGNIEVLDKAYDLVTSHEEDPAVCLSFFGMMLLDAFDDKAPAIPMSTTVEEGVWVRLTRPNGDPFCFVVAAEEDQRRGHYNSSNPIVAAALGHKRGGTFGTSTGVAEFEWTVTEIKPKALHLFHRLSNSFQDRFPDQNAFQSLRMVDNDIEPILDVIRKRSASIDRIFECYRDHPMPLGALAKASPASLPEIAFSLGATGRTLYIATGHPKDRDAERAVLNGGRRGPLVLDSVTAWVLAKMDMLGVLAKNHGPVLIPSSAVDELLAWAEGLRETGGRSMTMHAEGDTIIRTVHEEGSRNAQHTEIMEVVEKIRESVEVVGIGMPEFENADVRQLPDLLGIQFDTISVAVREQGTVLSLDLRFRQAAVAIVNCDAVGIDALLDYLLVNGSIDVAQHANGMMDLASQGCGVLSVSPALLIAGHNADVTAGKHRFAKLAGCLGTSNAEPVSHLDVSSAFADLAFREFPSLEAQAAIGVVLRALIRLSGIPSGQILREFSLRCTDQRCRNYVFDWARGHFLLPTIAVEGASS